MNQGHEPPELDYQPRLPRNRDLGIGCIGWRVPDTPEGSIFRTEAPKREIRHAEGFGAAHLVKGRHGVHEPYFVEDPVSIQITEMRV